MKKNPFRGKRKPFPLSLQIFRIMRIFLLLAIISVSQMFANTVSSQSLKLSVQDLTVREVFREIEKQSDYTFFFNDDFTDLGRTVSFPSLNTDIHGAMESVLARTNLSYRIIDDRLVVIAPGQFQEEIIIRGQVRAETGETLPGVSVYIKDTSIGTVTDSEGRYTLSVPGESAILVFSFVGMKPAEIRVGIQRQINVTLATTIASLEEVVVTGYQTLSKERVTGSFSRIPTEELNRTISFSIQDKLEGTVSGMLFDPLGLTIRGVSTLRASRIPLVIVNGFPLQVSLPTATYSDQAELEALQRAMESINPNDVESVTVLKDAAATSIWGSRAANGVIVITTKTGTTTVPEIQFNSSFGFTPKPDIDLLPFANPQTYLEIEKGRYDAGWLDNFIGSLDQFYRNHSDMVITHRHILDGKATETDLAFIESVMGHYDNRYEFSDYFLRGKANQQYNLSISQNIQFVNYRFSIAHDNNLAVSKGNENNRTVINLFTQYRPKDWISFDFNTNLNIRNYENNGVGINELYSIPQHQAILDGDGSYRSMSNRTGQGGRNHREEIVANNNYFPYDWEWNIKREFDNKDNIRQDNDYRLQAGIILKPFRDLITFDFRYQYERSFSDQQSLFNEETFFVRDLANRYAQPTLLPVPKGSIFDQFYRTAQGHNLRGTAHFRKMLLDDHFVTVLGGVDVIDQFNDQSNNRRYGYYPQTQAWATTMNFGTTYPRNLMSNNSPYYVDPLATWATRDAYTSRQDRFVSYFTNASYTYKERYDLTGSVRLDKSNSFGDAPQYRDVPLWSVGAGWTIDQEDFFQVDFINRLRLRATYGASGNIDKSTSPYAIANIGGSYNNAVMGVEGAAYNNPANPELRWEKTKQGNVAIDFSMWNNRIDGNIDFYSKTSSDLLTTKAINSTYGFNRALINFGAMNNRGVELYLSTLVINRDVRWRTQVMYSYNINEVTQTDPIDFDAISLSFIFTNAANRIVEGRPRHNLVSIPWGGLDSLGYPQFYHGDTLHNSMTTTLAVNRFGFENLIYNGAIQAPHYGSWNNIISYKGVELSALLTYKFGHYYLHTSPLRYSNDDLFGMAQGNFITRYARDWENMWREPGDEAHTDIPRLPFEYDALVRNKSWYGLPVNYGDHMIQTAAHIRISRVSLAYTLPTKWLLPIGLKNLTIAAQGRNLGVIVFNDFKEDPENLADMFGTFILNTLPEYTFSLRMIF
jgi:TonB-linked SusC/RagA family outer membrane protein